MHNSRALGLHKIHVRPHLLHLAAYCLGYNYLRFDVKHFYNQINDLVYKITVNTNERTQLYLFVLRNNSFALHCIAI